MAREDTFTTTVEGAAAHARMFADCDWDDAPTAAELAADAADPYPTAYTPMSHIPADPWASPTTAYAPPF